MLIGKWQLPQTESFDQGIIDISIIPCFDCTQLYTNATMAIVKSYSQSDKCHVLDTRVIQNCTRWGEVKGDKSLILSVSPPQHERNIN